MRALEELGIAVLTILFTIITITSVIVTTVASFFFLLEFFNMFLAVESFNFERFVASALALIILTQARKQHEVKQET